MSDYFTTYETVDFRPAPPGWTVHYFTDDPGIISNPLAGWEIQAATRRHRGGVREVADQPPLTERPRRIEPVDMDHAGAIEEPTSAINFWMITGPGEPTPTAEQISTAWQSWRAGQATR